MKCIFFARHEFVSAVILKVIVSWGVTHFSWVDMNQCFRGISWFHLQGRIVSCVGEEVSNWLVHSFAHVPTLCIWTAWLPCY